MDPGALLLAFVVVVAGAAVQGAIGFGFALLAAPLLALIDPTFVPGPVLIALLTLTVLMSVGGRDSLDWRGAGWAIGGRVPGSAVGAYALLALSEQVLAVTFASLVLAAVLLSVLGLRLRPQPPTLVTAGVLAGAMETTASIGGPPLALVYRRSSPEVARSTLSIIFVVGVLTSLAAVAAAGRLGVVELRLAVVLLPGVVAGLALSRLLRPVVDQGWLGPAVLALSAGSAVAVLVRALAGSSD